MREDFPRLARLRSNFDFQRVFKGASFRVTSGPFLLLSTRDEVALSRLGLAIPKRYIKKANQRNRLKRLIRESFRKKRNELPKADIVILARDGSEDLIKLKGQIAQAVDKLWQKFLKQYNHS